MAVSSEAATVVYGAPVKRIYVIGTSGVGKTRLARELSQRLKIKHIELDSLFFLSNWERVESDEFVSKVQTELSGDEWIIDGNFSQVRDLVLERADTVIFLDFSRWLIMSQLIKRTLYRVVTQKELWHGNRETLRKVLSRDDEESILRWAWTTYRPRRERYLEIFSQPQFLSFRFVRLQDRSMVKDFLKKL